MSPSDRSSSHLDVPGPGKYIGVAHGRFNLVSQFAVM